MRRGAIRGLNLPGPGTRTRYSKIERGNEVGIGRKGSTFGGSNNVTFPGAGLQAAKNESKLEITANQDGKRVGVVSCTRTGTQSVKNRGMGGVGQSTEGMGDKEAGQGRRCRKCEAVSPMASNCGTPARQKRRTPERNPGVSCGGPTGFKSNQKERPERERRAEKNNTREKKRVGGARMGCS